MQRSAHRCEIGSGRRMHNKLMVVTTRPQPSTAAISATKNTTCPQRYLNRHDAAAAPLSFKASGFDHASKEAVTLPWRTASLSAA